MRPFAPMITLARAVAAAALIASAAPAAAHKAHVHGAATIQVVVKADRLSVEIESALDNLLGFEHAPRSDAERRRVDALAARLRDAGTVAATPPEAGCTAGSVRLEAPVLAGTRAHDGPAGAPPAADGGHGHLSARYEFTCATPQALAWLELRLFDGFPRLARIDAQAVGPRGQTAQRLTRDKRRLRL
ncbi:MAG: DUF2796 domain-containing protein [Burkholderiales bacterium]|nr:DUF2796 domain-containing protein [Burkholderiales bacterium]